MKNKKILIITISVLVTIIIVGIYFMFSRENTELLTKSQYELLIEKLDKKESFNLLIEERESQDVESVLKIANDFYDLEYDQTKMSDFSEVEYEILLKKLDLYDEKEHLTYPIFINIKYGEISSYLVGFTQENDIKNYLFNNNIVDDKYKNKDNYITDQDFKELSKTDKDIIMLYGKNDDAFYNIRKELIKGTTDYYLLGVGRTNTIEIETIIMDEIENKNGPYLIKFKEGKIKKYLTDITSSNISDKINEIAKE